MDRIAADTSAAMIGVRNHGPFAMKASGTSMVEAKTAQRVEASNEDNACDSEQCSGQFVTASSLIAVAPNSSGNA